MPSVVTTLSLQQASLPHCLPFSLPHCLPASLCPRQRDEAISASTLSEDQQQASVTAHQRDKVACGWYNEREQGWHTGWHTQGQGDRTRNAATVGQCIEGWCVRVLHPAEDGGCGTDMGVALTPRLGAGSGRL